MINLKIELRVIFGRKKVNLRGLDLSGKTQKEKKQNRYINIYILSEPHL